MFLSRKFFMLTAALFTLIMVGCSGDGRGGPTPTPIPPLIAYDRAIFNVERGPIIEEKSLIGEIVPSKQDDLFFRSSGFVTRILKKEGEAVKAGDLLAELQVDDLINQLEQSRIDLEVAQANLAKDQAQREYDLQKAQTEVKIWEKRVDLAKLDLASASGANKERAQINLDITQENLTLAEQAFKLLNEDTNPYLEQTVKRSELAVQRLESLVAERQVTAPYDGVVLNSSIRPGQEVDAYDTAFTIGDPALQVIQVPYDFDLASVLTEESEVSLFLDSADKVGKTVKYLPFFEPVRGEQAVNETAQTDYLYFSLPEGLTADQIPTGRNFKLVVVLGQNDDALLLPPAAIRSYKGLNFVIVLDGDRRRRVEIDEIGLKSPDRWEVFGDLAEGDQVLGP